MRYSLRETGVPIAEDKRLWVVVGRSGVGGGGKGGGTSDLRLLSQDVANQKRAPRFRARI